MVGIPNPCNHALPGEPLGGVISKVTAKGDTVCVETSWSRGLGGKVWLGVTQQQALYQAVGLAANTGPEQTFIVTLAKTVPQGELHVICVPTGVPVNDCPFPSFTWAQAVLSVPPVLKVAIELRRWQRPFGTTVVK